MVIAACSPRVKFEELDFPNCLVERCNIRELVAWTQEPKAEETQALAEDYLRMYCARVKKSELPEPYQTECDKTILVIGGGAAGLSAALEAANDGYQVVLVEKEAELGGYGAKMYRQTPSSYPFTTLQEPTVFKKIKEVQSHTNIRVMTGRGHRQDRRPARPAGRPHQDQRQSGDHPGGFRRPGRGLQAL